MRLRKIGSYEEANWSLRNSDLEEHNARYAVAAREKADFHLGLPARFDCEQVFCLKEERKVSPDWVVQCGPRWLQISKEQKVQVKPGDKVAVREHRRRIEHLAASDEAAVGRTPGAASQSIPASVASSQAGLQAIRGTPLEEAAVCGAVNPRVGAESVQPPQVAVC